jgi:hypothetical protein
MASFLETMLALGLVAGFSTGLFMLSRNQQQAATAILDEFKGSRQGMQALSIVTEELANAKIPLRSVASDSVSFDSVSNPTPVTISLPGGGSSDPLQFNKGSRLTGIRFDVSRSPCSCARTPILPFATCARASPCATERPDSCEQGFLPSF